ncbi:hypothetical protein ASD64_07160 [Mesorhizobium sp. Root157]|uniref:hypothetical protein n=1 Tax=Mesorhizobium sp. Root157 TaxID=1736477 RepID=UPI0006FBDC5E|nr:hypothetical protein [Mesorhizobium sp. Root157]KQZ87211.1 hypothetical protein ASD64_07160 [Mesorhizobium sp. Root157]
MDLTQLLAWIVAANTVTTFATTAYNLMSTRATKALKAIENLEDKIGKFADQRQRASEDIGERFQKVENRLLKIEGEMQHMPDRDQSHRLELALEKLTGQMETLDSRMTGRMDTLDERLRPLAATSARIQNYLMEQGVEK